MDMTVNGANGKTWYQKGDSSQTWHIFKLLKMFLVNQSLPGDTGSLSGVVAQMKRGDDDTKVSVNICFIN